jgi:ATP-dependent Lon protease
MSASAGLDRRREYTRKISELLLMRSALADLLMKGRGEHASVSVYSISKSDNSRESDARFVSVVPKAGYTVHMNPIASLRPSTLRGLAYYLQHSKRRVPTRYLSILPERQPIPIRSPLLPNSYRSQVIRLDSSPDDPPGSSAGSSPPPSSSSSGGDGSDGSDPPSSSPPDHPTPLPSTSISRQSVPENYPQVLALPIARRPLFPGFYKAVVIRNPQVVAAVKEMMKRGQPYLGAFLLKDEQADSDVITDVNSVHPVGVFAQITSVFAAVGAPGREDEKEDALTAVLYPHRRIRITDLVKAGAFHTPTAQVHSGKEELPTPPPSPEPAEAELSVEHAKRHPGAPVTPLLTSQLMPFLSAPLQTSFLQDYDISIVNITNLFTQPYNKDDQYIRAFMSEIVSVFKDIAQLNPLFRDQITNFSMNQVASNVFDEPDKLADFAAAVSTGEVGELQDVLEALVVEDRLRKALLVLKKELINAQLQSKLSRDVDSKIAKRQREYYLMEQLKGIKKELGMESDGKDKLIEKLKARAAQLAMPELVKRVFDEELAKLAHLEPAASEANVTRNYLDWLTQIPWGQHSPENYSIAHAKQVLDEDHYGLKDVKDRILEFLAVGKLRGSVEGKIICLVGPPGVGKTSIGKSIARALERQFFRFSVGGLTDVAEIKGHRRTYVGYVPPRVYLVSTQSTH